MINWSLVLYVGIINFLAIISPGPDFFIVLKNALTDSRRGGIFTALGITTGSGILFTLSLLGVGALIAENELIFKSIKFFGAFYLIYLAIKAIFYPSNISEPELLSRNLTSPKNTINNDLKNFRVGLICNLTNPKAIMFMISLSSYIVQQSNNVKQTGLIIILVSMSCSMIWFSLVSSIFGLVKLRMMFYKKQKIINVIFGLILIYVAINILFL